MTSEELREQIAIEAARLMLRGKEQDFAAARKRAARWLKRKRLTRDEIPSNQEIQVQLYAMSGLMASERDPALRQRLQQAALEIVHALGELPVAISGAVTADVVAAGMPIVLEVAGDRDDVQSRLASAGIDTLAVTETTGQDNLWTLRAKRGFPCELHGVTSVERQLSLPGRITHEQLRERVDATPLTAADDIADDEHPDAFEVFRMLLEPLARVQLDPRTHPEGDALYHSLQVFELGKAAQPYDEEFLLACLLHEVGRAINPRHPVLSGLDALGTLITNRTRFLIEQRPNAAIYLQTGECPKALRKSENFDDVLLLARCDRDGRVPGASVCTLDEALEYLESLDTAWDD